MFYRFTFQKSLTWEGSSNNLNTRSEPVIVSAKSEARARRRLTDPGMGRSWICVGNEPKI